MSMLRVLFSSGVDRSFATYIRQAAIGLGFDASFADSTSFSYCPVLRALKERCGIHEPRPMDAAYFCEHGRNDLEAFAAAAEVSLEHLSLGSRGFYAQCANGEQCSLYTYLSRRAVVIGRITNMSEGHRLAPLLLREWKRELGFDVRAYDMDASYFGNLAQVAIDMDAFVKAFGYSYASDLTGGMRFGQKVTARCTNGETVTWRCYISRAAAALLPDVSSVKQGAYNKARACKELQQIYREWKETDRRSTAEGFDENKEE